MYGIEAIRREATVVITAIHNRTKETITIPHQQRGPISIEPGGTLEGPFIYTYDPEKEGAIPSPNQAWFVGPPTSSSGERSRSRVPTPSRPRRGIFLRPGRVA